MKYIYALTLLMAFPVAYGKYTPCVNYKKFLAKEKIEIKKKLREDRKVNKQNINDEYNGKARELRIIRQDKEIVKLSKAGTVSNAISCLKDLSYREREALMAQWLKLVFTASGKNPYYRDEYHDISSRDIYIVEKELRDGSSISFVDSKGATHFYADAVKKIKPDPDTKGALFEVLKKYGTDFVFCYFADEITKMCLNTFKIKIEELPTTAKYAWLAEAAGLMYTDDGQDPYHPHHRKGNLYIGVSTSKKKSFQPISRAKGEPEAEERPIGEYSFPQALPDAKFLAPDGSEYTKKDAWSKAGKQGKAISDLLYWCAELVGIHDVLALYPQEIKAMSEQRKKK